MPDPEPMQSAGANSLWRSGAKGFFRDQRARRVGDVLTVQVAMSDNASWSNETTRSRQTNDKVGIPDFFGLQNPLVEALPNNLNGLPIDPAEIVKLDSRSVNAGKGGVNRDEEIRLNLAAAVITQVLRNGNLVIQGRQEVRVNFEMREVMVAGIVHPETSRPRTRSVTRRLPNCASPMAAAGSTPTCSRHYGAQMLEILLPY